MLRTVWPTYDTHCQCGIASGLGTGTGFQSSSINVLNPTPVAVSTIFLSVLFRQDSGQCNK